MEVPQKFKVGDLVYCPTDFTEVIKVDARGIYDQDHFDGTVMEILKGSKVKVGDFSCNWAIEMFELFRDPFDEFFMALDHLENEKSI